LNKKRCLIKWHLFKVPQYQNMTWLPVYTVYAKKPILHENCSWFHYSVWIFSLPVAWYTSFACTYTELKWFSYENG
jgi:hypothetical protein